MTKQVQLRRGTTSEHQVFTGAVGELTIDTTVDVAVVHDGITPGGHYLVGTGFGATVFQGIVNKSFVGIGTSTTGDVQFFVVGSSIFDGPVESRGLNVVIGDPIIDREGTLNDSDPLTITGINTDSIRLGYSVFDEGNVVISEGTEVVSIGIGSIGISQAHSLVGTGVTLLSFSDVDEGKINSVFLNANQSILVEVGINTSYTESAFINSGIITTANINSAIIDNSGISTAYVNNIYVNSGILTTVGITSAVINELFVNSGIITDATINTASVNNIYVNSGILTAVGINTAVINELFVNSGIATGLTANTLFSTNSYIVSGIITDVYSTNISVSNLYVASGIVTNLNVTNAFIDSAYISSGIATDINITNTYVDTANINSGIITTAGISTANITIANLNTANINQGIATSFNVDTSSITNAYITNGISSTFNITDTYVGTAKINAGIITTGNVDNLHSSQVSFGVGIGTTSVLTEARIDTLYVSSGILTSSRVGFSTLDSVFISTSRTNTGFATYFDVTGVGTIQRLESPVGFITYLNGSDINYSGISTFGNVNIGIGNTDLIVSGDVRITGILSVGQGTVTIDGSNSSVSGIDSLRVASGFVTSLSGTDINYSGVSTFNTVGVTTLSLVGINTFLNNQDKSVTLALSNSGLATNYTLTLPPTKGTAGQLLALLPDGNLGFTTNGAGLFESRYYVSAQNGDDTYDGRALPVRTIKRAAQLASFDSFISPGNRYLDAGNLLESNKDFIVEEAVAYIEFNYENIGVATIFPDYDPVTWKSGIGSAVDALTYDVRFGGNSKSREIGFQFANQGTFTGEEDPIIFGLDYVKFISQFIINNQSPPTLYQFPLVENQTFDFTIIQDPLNNNINYFHRSKDARNLIVGNRQEIIDKSLASVALAATTGFYFPGESESNERSRYYDAYKLIQINRQEIIDYAWNRTVSQYPGISATQTKCKRDLGYFVDAVSTDVFTGGNNYARSFAGFYFDAFGNPISNGLFGEETESIYAFEQAKVGMSSAVCNLLTNKDLTITPDPVTGSNTSPNSCANVRSTISTLVGIVTSVISAGSTAGIGTTTNYGYFVVNSEFNVRDSVGIGSTNIVGGRKCARDLGYIVDAVAQDVSYGTNQHIIYATKRYFDGTGVARTDGLVGEEVISGYAFTSLAYYSKLAVTNQLNYQDLTILPDVGVGTNKGSTTCANTQATIDNLVGILTTAVLTGSLSGISSVNLGITDCADVRSAIVNYVGIITTVVGYGTAFAPELNAPQTQSKPVCIFVEAGEYLEDNPIILYDDVAIVGDNLRNTIIRPLNGGKDLFRVRNGVYLTGFAMKDSIDIAGVPQNKFDYAVAFDDPTDPFTSRTGYATKTEKPVISRSPYIQNCSILSFLGANGILVDGNKVQTPNTPIIKEEVEVDPDNQQPEQGKSMVAAAFTMVSFGGIGWRTINDGYAQVVSCFQIFCRYGSLAQSGGYLSITNSATNFGLFSLRSTGFSKNSFIFDRGRVAATGTSGGLQTLKAIGYGRSDLDNYILRFFDNNNVDRTSLFKPSVLANEVIASPSTINVSQNTITILNHGFVQGDAIVYNGDEQEIPPRIIGGLVNDNQYYLQYIDNNTFRLFEDEGLDTVVNLTSTSSGIHTFTKATQDFFVREILLSGTHNQYQKVSLASTSSTLNFVPGRLVSQTVVGGTAVGFALTYNSSTRELIVGLEISEGSRRNFSITNGTTILSISDHSESPVSVAVTSVVGLSTYWTMEFKVDSTTAGNNIINIGSLPETYKLHFHRPSIVNSSSHTWEYSGSGIDYNALPQNGGQTDFNTEQVSELGGRVYSSGTNELGDFKIGRDITAYNRTGNIIFNNTVTIGTLDSLRLSLSGGTAVEEFSIDFNLGDNEIGGPQNRRVSTQLAVRSFLNNRLGSFIDKTASTNAIPNSIVQLNSTGQINADLIPPKTVNYFRVPYDDGRLQLANYIPATDLSSGDTVVEPTAPFVLISDAVSQYLILDNSTIYNFQNGDPVVSVVSAGGATGVVTAPPYIGINTTIVDAGVGYGTTGLVRGVPLGLKNLTGGSGYNVAGIYTGVRLDTSSGIGTGISATITVSAAGTVSNVAINTGGYKFAINDILTLNDPTPIGGRTGGSNFSVQVSDVETRLYLRLTNGQKFPGTAILPDYISDRNAVAISTNIGIGYTVSFNPTDISVAGDVDFAQDRIVVGLGHSFADGDPVIYDNGGGVTMGQLQDDAVYYIKTVGLTSVQLYTSYALVTIKSLTSSGTGTHTLSRVGVNTITDQITFINHGFTQGDPVKVTGNTPIGVTTGNFYFIGAVTQNTFTLHQTRSQALAAINGLLLNTVDLSEGTIQSAVGIMTLTEQNIEYSDSINTSSTQVDNWSLLATGTLDAANIVSGIFSPTRLGTGAANEDTFLSGNSSYLKVVKSVGIGTTQPIGVTATSSDLAPNGVGISTYYGDIRLTLNRVQATLEEYSLLGISKYKTSTFNIGSDGAVSLKNSLTGDIDAATLGGQSSAYYLDIANTTGSIPITRGGTGLSALPSEGFTLLGNGSAYTLTGDPTFAGTVSAGFAVLAGKDISFTTGAWTGEKAGKIQYHNNSLYLQFTTSLIHRNSSGADVFTIGNNGNTTITGTIQGTRLISTIATGTAPLTVSSTTEVANLNVQYLNGYSATTTNTADAIVRRDASNQIFAGRLELSSAGSTTVGQLTFSGTTNNWINFNQTGVAAPAFTTRSVGTKIVLYSNITASAADYALGIESSTLWYSVPTTSQQFKWYGGTTLAATLSGAGALTLVGALSATTLTSTVATGTAPLTVSSTTLVTNLNADLLDGLQSATAATANTIVARDASGNITGARVDATTHRAATHDITADTNNRFQQGALVLRSTSPTVYLRDTDHNVSMLHCNSNIFYILRGANDSETWTQVNSVWPMQINLTNNNATFGGTVTASSDVRFKKNIATIQDALDKVLNMRGVTFERLETPGIEIGVIAQEVEEVVPEVVTTDENGHKSVAYANISALLIEAIKEQQVQINKLHDEIKKLKGE